jgi:hypothetical protein
MNFFSAQKLFGAKRKFITQENGLSAGGCGAGG